MKNLKERNKGITLVALVITIIILLILAGISISALTNTGLFAKAKDAKTETRGASVQEAKDLWKVNQELDNYGKNGTAQTLEELLNDLENQKLITADERETIEKKGQVTIGSRTIVFKTLADYVKPGDYVAYTPDAVSETDTSYTNLISELGTYSGSTGNTSDTLTQESLNWRVLDIKDGKVRLISEKPTESMIELFGPKGYNNAVYLIDKTCSTLYNNSTYAVKAQNLKIEDIQDYLIYDYTQYENSKVDTGKYGGTATYTRSIYIGYPNLFAKEKTGWVDDIQGTELNLSEQITPIDETSTRAETSIKAIQTYWVKKMTSGDFKESIYYDLFIGINNYDYYPRYWISSRCVNNSSYMMGFFIRYAYSGNVDAYHLFDSSGSQPGTSNSFRPVITLNSNVVIKSGDGTSTTPYEIGI